MIITVAGVVAYQNPDQIAGAVRAAMTRWKPRRILLDVDDVSVLDGAGIAALLASHHVGAQSGTPVILINACAFLTAQLREYGVQAVLCDSPGRVEVPQLPISLVPRPLG
ncbi:STAS domain-containing protein [Actinoplanes sp. NPDC051859]|uniref:STAS domain-containing protein n=1 Tax=Actinoplanes sp. NPDC051859 TaxID=3363909 RepID=UPI0037A4CDCD